MPANATDWFFDKLFVALPLFTLWAALMIKLIRRRPSEGERRFVTWIARALVAYGVLLLAAWPFVWFLHYQHRDIPRMTPGFHLFVGLVPICCPIIAGLGLSPEALSPRSILPRARARVRRYS